MRAKSLNLRAEGAENLRLNESDDFFDDFRQSKGGRVDLDGTFGTYEWGRFSTGVHLIPCGDGIGLALLGTPGRAGGFVCMEEETIIGIGKNDRTDIAAFHDEASEALFPSDSGLAALILEKKGPERRQSREGGYGRVDLG